MTSPVIDLTQDEGFLKEENMEQANHTGAFPQPQDMFNAMMGQARGQASPRSMPSPEQSPRQKNWHHHVTQQRSPVLDASSPRTPVMFAPPPEGFIYDVQHKPGGAGMLISCRPAFNRCMDPPPRSPRAPVHAPSPVSMHPPSPAYAPPQPPSPAYAPPQPPSPVYAPPQPPSPVYAPPQPPSPVYAQPQPPSPVYIPPQPPSPVYAPPQPLKPAYSPPQPSSPAHSPKKTQSSPRNTPPPPTTPRNVAPLASQRLECPGRLPRTPRASQGVQEEKGIDINVEDNEDEIDPFGQDASGGLRDKLYSKLNNGNPTANPPPQVSLDPNPGKAPSADRFPTQSPGHHSTPKDELCMRNQNPPMDADAALDQQQPRRSSLGRVASCTSFGEHWGRTVSPASLPQQQHLPPVVHMTRPLSSNQAAMRKGRMAPVPPSWRSAQHSGMDKRRSIPQRTPQNPVANSSVPEPTRSPNPGRAPPRRAGPMTPPKRVGAGTYKDQGNNSVRGLKQGAKQVTPQRARSAEVETRQVSPQVGTRQVSPQRSRPGRASRSKLSEFRPYFTKIGEEVKKWAIEGYLPTFGVIRQRHERQVKALKMLLKRSYPSFFNPDTIDKHIESKVIDERRRLGLTGDGNRGDPCNNNGKRRASICVPGSRTAKSSRKS